MLIGFVGLAQVIPKDGLIAYYPFDGNAQDQGSNNLHGTVLGATLTADRFGNPNSAYHFDGVDDMIDIPNNPLLKPPLPFSISLWIKPDGFSVQWTGIFSSDQADHAGMSLRYDPQDHYIIGDYSDAMGTTSDHRRSIHTSIPLSTEWHHVVFICRGPTDMDVYIDGRKDPVENYGGLGGPIGYTNAPSGIGYHIFSGIQHFFGAIDDLAFYGKALSECEVLQLYSNIDRGLVVSYPFSGNAQDISIHGLHGTVFGATLTEDRHGNPNSAYLFDGAGDKIVLPNHPLLKPQVPISVSLWLRPDAFGPAWGGVFSNDHEIGNHTGMTMYCNPTLKTLNGSIGDGGGNSPAHRRTVHSSKTLSTNWQHGVIVYRGANDFDLYLDGEKDLGVTYSGTGGDIAYSSDPPGIGYNTAAIPFYFLGALDDFNFYNRSLSSCEVRELYSPGRLFGIDSVLEICQNDTFEISTDLFNPAWYFDGVFLDSTESISVEINHSGLLTAQGENYCGCFEVDSFQFEFYPYPDPRISFSDSVVCPSPSVEYSYAVKGFQESDFLWSIQGGEIIAGPAKDSILVRWDEPDGLSLEVEEVPSWECNSKSLEFPIYSDSTHLDLLSLGFNQAFDQMELMGFSNHSIINTNTDLFLLNKPDSGSIALLDQQQVNTDVNTFFLDSSLGA